MCAAEAHGRRLSAALLRPGQGRVAGRWLRGFRFTLKVAICEPRAPDARCGCTSPLRPSSSRGGETGPGVTLTEAAQPAGAGFPSPVSVRGPSWTEREAGGGARGQRAPDRRGRSRALGSGARGLRGARAGRLRVGGGVWSVDGGDPAPPSSHSKSVGTGRLPRAPVGQEGGKLRRGRSLSAQWGDASEPDCPPRRRPPRPCPRPRPRPPRRAAWSPG